MAASKPKRIAKQGKHDDVGSPAASARLDELLNFSRAILHRDEEDVLDEIERAKLFANDDDEVPDDADWNIRRLLEAARRFADDVHAAAKAEPAPAKRELAIVPDRIEAFARDILPVVLVLAEGGLVPVQVLSRGNDLFERDSAAETRPLLPWQAGLVRALALNYALTDARTGFPVGRGATLESLDLIFNDTVGESGLEGLPPVMRYFGPGGLDKRHEPKLRAAVAVLKEIRIAQEGERTGGKSKVLSPFAAAGKLARALGLTFPEREYDLRRPARTRR